ncbi:Hsp70 family protein [Plantactinospora sp. CA-290183]|uniref:Hsp70 family protein n=1 Tax=Plantactinospora sp. CA-290183 TaxID=3240006 RepID=UPI003D8DB21F
MAGQAGGYGLGVDLGTSHTVAVLRWPDGRTRPLLFDGQPILPSGVFLDGAGRLHAGRDAQRLAQADPARYEPNPKRRIDEPTVLLGDREVPTVDLLAGILRAVASAAVEATGFLPPAVLSYPASWGTRRREALTVAVGRAGWPPVALVPEPVAAARYFADVLRRPVPVGSALAVFDFGGGTLDIAVVRNEGVDGTGRPRFAVVGSGGVPDLGGLDLDAALVEQLGRIVAAGHGPVWQRLSRPGTTAEWRNRRQFWDDVRGAKEMLSRSTVAPVPVPGIEQALHLTRDELEAVVTPLLRRGVREAASVIAHSRVGVDQLSGLFLVGGSSRVPLLARLLHAELGIAPTVLEQPELPVAEGALAELPPPVTVPAAVPPPLYPGSPAGPPAPVSPGVPAYPGGAAGKGRGWRRRAAWIGAGVALALVGVVTAAVLYLTRDPYPALDFQDFAEIGRVTAREKDPTSLFTATAGDRAYVAYQRDDQRLDIAVLKPGSATVLRWITTESGSEHWAGITALPDALIVRAHAVSSSTPREISAYDPDDGRKLWGRVTDGNDDVRYFERHVVLLDKSADTVVGIDVRSGAEWVAPSPKGEYDSDSAIHPVRTAVGLGGPADPDGEPTVLAGEDDPRLVEVGADGSIRVLDVATGKELRRSRPKVAGTGDLVLAYQDQVFVAAATSGYGLLRFDLARLGEATNLYTAPDKTRRPSDLQPCGEQQVCLLETASSNGDTTQLVAVRTDGGAGNGQAEWRRDVPQAQRLLPVGENVVVGGSTPRSLIRLFTVDGAARLTRDGVGVRVDGGNLLVFDGALSTYSDDASVAGVVAGSGQLDELGQLKGVHSARCSWNSALIVCPAGSEFVLARFAGS